MQSSRDEIGERFNSVGFLLLCHHPPQHMNRTITFKIKGKAISVCARCSGILAGILLVLAAGLAGFLPPLTPQMCLLVVLACSVPAVLDFHLQLMSIKESTNFRRINTGALFGVAVALSLRQVMRGSLIALIFIPLILIAYLSWIFNNQARGKHLLLHLELYREHFERCRAEDIRAGIDAKIKRAINNIGGDDGYEKDPTCCGNNLG